MKEIKTYIFSNTTKYRRLLACYLVGFMACCFASCSDEDGGGALSDSGTLTFTLGGIAEDSEETLTRAQLEPETIRQDLGDGLSLVYTLSLDPQTATRADAYPVKDKTKYRIIVYKDNGDFVTEQQFTAGETARIENLEKVKYKLAAYSYNTEDDLDEVGSSATTLTVDPKNDLLHWTGSVDLTSGKADPVNITFKHRFTHLTVKISSYLMGKSSPIINVPSSATLTPGYKGEQTLLTDTKLTQLSDFAEPQTFAFGTAPNDTVAASTTTRYVFTGNKPVTMDFSGDLIIDAPSGTKTVQNPTVTFNKKPDGLLPGHFYTLAMRIEASKGNYYPYDLAIGKDYEATIPLGDNRTYSYTRADGTPVNGKTELTFLRYNLGADPSMSPKEQMAYPFTDVKNIRVYGGLFQWGRKDVEHSLRDPYSASDTEHFQNAQYPSYDPINDHKFAWGTTSWWCASDNKESNMWGNGGGYTKQTDFSYNSAKPNTTANDWNPCPTGYRVPTQHEWALIINEGGDSKTNSKDEFTNTFDGQSTTNVSSHGDTWYISDNNTNVVWVRVSEGKALTYNKYLESEKYVCGWAVYNAQLEAINTQDKRNTVFDAGNDLTLSAAPEPLMFLPAAGFRDRTTGKVYQNKGGSNYYWTSTVSDNTLSSSMYFDHAGIHLGSGRARAHGASVRCVKDE